MTNSNELLMMRPSWLTVDLAAIQYNAKQIMAHAGATRLIAVVKADAYGHGAVAVTAALYEIGVRDFAVATIAEGVALRQQVPYDDFNIILLGVQDVQYVPVMVSQRLTPAVGTLAWLDEAEQLLNSDDQLMLQLAVDTGMGRMGAHSEAALQEMYDKVLNTPSLQLSGVFTHFATADDTNQTYYDQQVANFNAWVTAVGIPKQYWHLANSGSALWHHDQIETGTIRVGSVLYGYNPGAPELPMPVTLKNVLSLKSRIGAVLPLQAGESVSCGAS